MHEQVAMKWWRLQSGVSGQDCHDVVSVWWFGLCSQASSSGGGEHKPVMDLAPLMQKVVRVKCNGGRECEIYAADLDSLHCPALQFRAGPAQASPLNRFETRMLLPEEYAMRRSWSSQGLRQADEYGAGRDCRIHAR